MELYYAGYTVGWPVGLGETLIKTITTAGLKTVTSHLGEHSNPLRICAVYPNSLNGKLRLGSETPWQSHLRCQSPPS